MRRVKAAYSNAIRHHDIVRDIKPASSRRCGHRGGQSMIRIPEARGSVAVGLAGLRSGSGGHPRKAHGKEGQYGRHALDKDADAMARMQ